MKVLQIVSSCSKSAGVMQVIMNYYRQVADKVTFDFLIFRDVSVSFEKEIEKLGGKVYKSGKPNLTTLKKYHEFLDNFFKEHKGEYDAVHLNELYISGPIFKYAKKYGIKKLIAHSHCPKTSEKIINSIRNKFLFLPCRKNATLFLGCSHTAGKVFGKRIQNGNNFFVLNNAFEPEKYNFSEDGRNAVRSEFGIEKDTVLLGHVGRFTKGKNHPFLIDVFNEYQKLNTNSKLLLLGDGGTEIKEKVKKLKLEDKVIFAGVRTDTVNFYSAFDALVFPSIFEGLGNVVVESQATGLTCFVSNGVPQEACYLKNCKRLPLKLGAKLWAKTIFDTPLVRDKNGIEMTEKNGFNIKKEASNLLKYYKKA